MERNLLLDAPLVPDPDEAREMGASDAVRSLTDEDLSGCRLLLYQEAVEALPGGGGGVVKLGCAFQPTPGARFVDALLALSLTTPAETTFIDVGPKTKRSEHPVKLTVDARGKLEATVPGVTAGTEAGVTAEYEVYHCDVNGTGHGTRRARWVFMEDPHVQNGLSHAHALAFTVDTTGAVSGSLLVSARVRRSGLKGGIDAVRSLIFGPDERLRSVTFEIPAAPAPRGLSRFFRKS